MGRPGVSGHNSKADGQGGREDRLADELRENLKKRKELLRKRARVHGDTTGDLDKKDGDGSIGE